MSGERRPLADTNQHAHQHRPLHRKTPEHAAAGDLVGKGLAHGEIGTFSGAMLGVSSVAPGYTLTASIGLIVASVGSKMPAIFIAGFVPMFLTAYAYRELNTVAPDCGASFTWSTKARSAPTWAGCVVGEW